MNMPRIIVEGSIGSGKSTLTKRLAKDLDGIAVLEGVLEDGDADGCPWLKKYYQTHKLDCPNTGCLCPVDWMAPGIAFKTQMWFISNRFNKYRQMEDVGKIYIGDRSLWGDMAFAITQKRMGKMEPEEFTTYANLWDTMMGILEPPDIMIYIKCSVDFLVNRIAGRGREIEKAISREYLTELQAGYDEMLARGKNCKALLEVHSDQLNSSSGGIDPSSPYYQEVLRFLKSKLKIEVFSK